MKKKRYLIAALFLMVFSSISFASQISYYSVGSSDSAKFKKTRYVNNIGNKRRNRNISIAYNIENNWTINSAKLWIRAIDDFKGGYCSKGKCKDRRVQGRDPREKARISEIEGQKYKYWSYTEINRGGWYELLDVTTFLLNDTNKMFSAKLQATIGRDIQYRNAKLVIDYDINVPAPATGPSVPPIDSGSTVPVPSAVWLFGSALLGFAGLRRKPSFMA